jgi:hypothetical protein
MLAVQVSFDTGSHMKKGRHRRFEEARALKQGPEVKVEPCAECGADPEDDHASWCLATEDDEFAEFGKPES